MINLAKVLNRSYQVCRCRRISNPAGYLRRIHIGQLYELRNGMANNMACRCNIQIQRQNDVATSDEYRTAIRTVNEQLGKKD